MNNSIDESQIDEHIETWRKLALSTQSIWSGDNPQDLRASFEMAYRSAGLSLPDQVIWLESPMAGAIAASIISMDSNNIHERIIVRPYELAQNLLKKRLEHNNRIKQWLMEIEILESKPFPVESNIANPIRRQIGIQLVATFAKNPDTLNSPDQLISESCWANIVDYLSEQLNQRQRQNLHRTIREDHFPYLSAAKSVWYCGLGNLDGGSLIALDYADKFYYELDEIKGLLALTRSSGWWWAFEDVCIITSRPNSLLLDNDNRLHNDYGAAVTYSDGWSILSRHGNFVPERVIEFAHRPDLKIIESEQNAEVRRHLVEIYGLERFLIDSEAVRIDQDECGALYRRDFIQDEPIVVVKVKNSTPEPDGTYKWYFLRVPPETKTAREAVAWTFGLSEHEYKPERET